MKIYLVPRLSSRLGNLAPRHPIIDNAQDQADHLLYDNLTHAALRGAEAAARDALRDFLLDTSALGKRIGLRKRHRSSPSIPSIESTPSPQPPSRSTSSSFGFRLVGFRPEVEWRYSIKADENAVQFRVNSDGAAGMSFSRSTLTHTNVSVAYSPRYDQYNLYLSLDF